MYNQWFPAGRYKIEVYEFKQLDEHPAMLETMGDASTWVSKSDVPQVTY